MRRAAAAVAVHLGIDLTIETVAVPAGPSPEAQSRAVRHRVLERSLGPDEFLVTGHQAGDQAETIIGNLLRGAGSRGLAGIPARRDPWVRPLLGVTRAEIRELAGLLEIPFRDDPANADRTARRNVLRHEVIPHLERRFNPALQESLQRTGAALAADDALLESFASTVPATRSGDAILLPAPVLATLPRAVAARVVRNALRSVRGPYPGDAAEVEEVLAVATGPSRRAGLSGGLEVVREGPHVVIHLPGGAAPVPVGWGFPGSARFGRFLLDAWIDETPPATRPLGRSTAVFDADVIGDAAVIRAPAAGDQIDVGIGSKSVADALREGGVGERRRAEWPLVEVRGKIAWIAGVRAAGWTWTTTTTRRFLWLTIEEDSP
jgi:tRNA(Ile)-lysidine synthase